MSCHTFLKNLHLLFSSELENFKIQIGQNSQERHINMRAYKLNHNGVEKYAIRYIRKM